MTISSGWRASTWGARLAANVQSVYGEVASQFGLEDDVAVAKSRHLGTPDGGESKL